MSPDILNFFASFIEKETGISYQENTHYQLQMRLEEIAAKEGLAGVYELQQLIKQNKSHTLSQELLDKATNNETFFFRDESYFTAMKDFIGQIVNISHPKEIKIWSAAASTGQEAISVAIMMDELAQKMHLPPVSITATDICEKALAKARAGVYTEFETKRGLSPERRSKYFTKLDDGWTINSTIQSKITYANNNLTRSTVKDTFHIILCRNVLIYQKPELKKQVVDTLLNKLEACGGLMLGGGEMLLGISDDIEVNRCGTVPFYRYKSSTNIKAG